MSVWSLTARRPWHLSPQVLTNLTLNAVRQRAAASRGDDADQVDMLGFSSPIHGVAAGRFDPNNDADAESLRCVRVCAYVCVCV